MPSEDEPNAPRPTDTRTLEARATAAGDGLTEVFVDAALASVLALGFGLWVARLFTGAEAADRVVSLGLLSASLLLVGRSLFRPTRAGACSSLHARFGARVSRRFRALVLLGVLTFSAAQFDVYEFEVDLWSGFGPKLAIAAIGICLCLTFYGSGFFAKVDERKASWRRRAPWAMATLCIVYYLPSAIQGPNSVMSPYDALFGLHETLSPVAGRSPIGDSISQYGSLLGWPLVLVKSLLVSDPLGFATYYLSALAIASLGLLCWVAGSTLPRGRRWLGPVLVLPLVLIKQRASAHPTGSIAALFSALPLRLLLPVVLVLILLRSRRWITAGNAAWAFAVGSFAGLTVLNNLEFGAAAVLSSGVVVLAATAKRWRLLGFGSIGAAMTFGSYALFLRLRGTSFDVENYTAFVRGFSKGFGAFPIPAFGLWILVFGCLFASLAVGLRGFARARIAQDVDTLVWAQACVATFFGFFGCATASYYAGRSIVSGQLQVFLVFLSPASIATFGLCSSEERRGVQGAQVSKTKLRAPIEFAPVVFPVALAVASLLAAPSALYEWRRVRSEDRVVVFADELRVVDALRASPVDSIYFGRLGNVVSIRSGRTNATLTNDPTDFEVSDRIVFASCRRLASFGAVPLYVDRGSVRYLQRCPKMLRQRIVVI